MLAALKIAGKKGVERDMRGRNGKKKIILVLSFGFYMSCPYSRYFRFHG